MIMRSASSPPNRQKLLRNYAPRPVHLPNGSASPLHGRALRITDPLLADSRTVTITMTGSTACRPISACVRGAEAIECRRSRLKGDAQRDDGAGGKSAG